MIYIICAGWFLLSPLQSIFLYLSDFITMNSCESCDKIRNYFQPCHNCYSLVNQKEFNLLPNVVNEIEIYSPHFLDPTFIIEITHYVFFKHSYWIPNRYYFYDYTKKTVILQIITPDAITVPRGETICHYRFISPDPILLKLGKTYFLQIF
jgi:hypothetical protein